MKSSSSLQSRRGGFTLVELLVVVVIIAIVSAATLPVVIPAFNHRKVSEGARILQAALMGARDAAIRANAPRGIRLLPDPVFNGQGSSPLASNRMIPIEPAADYNEGYVTIFASNLASSTDPRISITESVFNNDGTAAPATPQLPQPPTNWYWNIRQGDKIRFDDSGRYYTIAGPMTIGPLIASNGLALPTGPNVERYVNTGLPGTTSVDPYVKTYYGGERLYLVNGQDDDGDGWIDESFDGIDNDGDGIVDPGFNGIDDDGDGSIDEPDELLIGNEYENEQFIGSQYGTNFINKSYTIVRRPVVSEKAVEIPLPEGIVIDMTTWNAQSARAFSNSSAAAPSKPERSRVPVDPYSLFVDIMVTPTGQVLLPGGGSGAANSGGFGPQSSIPFYHFWVTEREDVYPPLFGVYATATDASNSSRKVVVRNVPKANPLYAANPAYRFLLPMPVDGLNGYDPAGLSAYNVPGDRALKGDRRLVTLFTRTGQVTTNEIESFDATNIERPYYGAQLGTREVK